MKAIMIILKRYRYWLLAGLIIIAASYSIVRRLTEKPTPTPNSTPKTNQPLSPFPTETTLSPGPIVEVAATSDTLISAFVRFPSLGEDGKELYYIDFSEGVIKKYTFATKESERIADGSVFIEQAAWSPSHGQTLLRLINGQGNRVENALYQSDLPYGDVLINHYLLKTGRLKKLNPSIIAFNFITNNQIIYQYKDNKQNNLVIARPDGSGWKNIAKLSGDVTIIRSGSTALVQTINDPIVKRYGEGGKLLDTYEVPNEFDLTLSSWAPTGEQAVYLVKTGSQITIKRLDGKDEKLIANITEEDEETTILWDNKTGNIYLAGSDSLEKLNVTVKND